MLGPYGLGWPVDDLEGSVSRNRHYAEQFILAHLLASPRLHAWEVGGLVPSMFSDEAHRLIAQALCDLRDQGRLIHWRRVSGLLKRRRQACWRDIDTLRLKAGACVGLTAAISYLHHSARSAA